MLKTGGVIVFPTDTLYGLGADPFSSPALERVCSIKGRPPGMALPLLVSGWEQASLVARRLPEAGAALAGKFWPGALTLVLPKCPQVPDLITGGGDTVAVRMPDHEVPLALACELGGPITGTSANRSGGPDLLTVQALEAELGGQVDYIISSPAALGGIPSTVVDITGKAPRLVREGALPFRDVLSAWSGV